MFLLPLELLKYNCHFQVTLVNGVKKDMFTDYIDIYVYRTNEWYKNIWV